jgi:hypothetical protein
LPVGNDSGEIAKVLKSVLSSRSPSERETSKAHKHVPLDERLFNARAICKKKTAAVAMHLDPKWQSSLFSQLDSLMDFDNWEKEDTPVTEASFATFLRMILLIRPAQRPGLGSTSTGNIIAAWTMDKNRLTIECLPHDSVRWVIFHYIDGKTESAAGYVELSRLRAALAPYSPERWFVDGG